MWPMFTLESRIEQWSGIAVVALALTFCIAGYVSVRKPFKPDPESSASKLMAIVWVYVSAFIVTTIAWGIISAMLQGYDLAS
jgi:hypothetical protein